MSDLNKHCGETYLAWIIKLILIWLYRTFKVSQDLPEGEVEEKKIDSLEDPPDL